MPHLRTLDTIRLCILAITATVIAAGINAQGQLAPSRPTELSPGQRSASNPASTRGPYLSELSAILSHSKKPLELNLLFPGSAELSMREIEFGAAVSQALALRAGERPVLVSRGTAPRAGKLNILIGTKTELAQHLTKIERDRIQNGYLSIQRVGPSPEDLLLVVSGLTSEKVADSIISLGLVKERFPNASHASIREVILPENAPFMRRAPLSPGETYTFTQLREAGAFVEARNFHPLTLNLFIPGFVATDSQEMVSLKLHYEHQRRAFGGSRTPEVSINGQSLKPSRTNRELVNEIEFLFPFDWLKSGGNTLQINAGTSSESSPVQIAESSSISLPAIEKHPTLPDLQLSARTFYPFIGEPSGRDLAIVLGSKDLETIESAWTLLARLAQSANTFFFQSRFTVGELDSSRHNVVISEFDHLPASLRRFVNLDVFQAEHTDLSVSDIAPTSRGTNLKMVIENWLERDVEKSAAKDHDVPDPIRKSTVTDDSAILTSVPSPDNQQLWNLILASSSRKSLRERTFDVIQPSLWDQIRGKIVLWGDQPGTMRAYIPGEASAIAKPTLAHHNYVEFPTGSRLPLSFWIGSTIGLLVLFTIVTRWALEKCDEAVSLRQRKPR